MKTYNFPGRKNERRKRALAHMSPTNPAYVVTKHRIRPDEEVRAIRTKIWRGDKAQFTR